MLDKADGDDLGRGIKTWLKPKEICIYTWYPKHPLKKWWFQLDDKTKSLLLKKRGGNQKTSIHVTNSLAFLVPRVDTKNHSVRF